MILKTEVDENEVAYQLGTFIMRQESLPKDVIYKLLYGMFDTQAPMYRKDFRLEPEKPTQIQLAEFLHVVIDNLQQVYRNHFRCSSNDMLTEDFLTKLDGFKASLREKLDCTHPKVRTWTKDRCPICGVEVEPSEPTH